MKRCGLLGLMAVVVAVLLIGCGEGQSPFTGDGSSPGDTDKGETGDRTDSALGSAKADNPEPNPTFGDLVLPGQSAVDNDPINGEIIPRDEEYSSLRCAIPDPEGLGPGKLFRRTPANGTVAVYVYDDRTCAPLADIAIQNGPDRLVYTDEQGQARLTDVPAGSMITAYQEDYRGWGYQADAAVMYFRLRPLSMRSGYADTPAGHFTLDGQNLALINPHSVIEGLLDPIYAGLALPGLSRDVISASRLFFALDAEWEMTFYNLGYPFSNGFPANVYVPEIDILVNVPDWGDLGFYGANEDLQLPYDTAATDMALGGFVASLDAGNAVTIEDVMSVLIRVLETDDVVGSIAPYVKSLLNEAITIPYLGIVPTCTPGGVPDIPVTEVEIASQPLAVSFTEPQEGYDYIVALGVEVPNRAILPLGFGAYEGDPVNLPLVELPNADYLAVAVKTDLLSSGVTSSRLSFAAQYAEWSGDWNGEVTFADSDFLPFFDLSASQYDPNTGELTWQMEGSDTDRIDAFWVFVEPWFYLGTPEYFSLLLPGDARGVNLIDLDVGWQTGGSGDLVVMALDLPFDYDEGFDPTRLLAYDVTSFSLWSIPEAALYLHYLFDI